MNKKLLLFCMVYFVGYMLQAQTPKQKQAVDSLIDYDVLFNDLESFFDSLYTPKSFGLINVTASNGYYNYQSSSTTLKANKQITLIPSIAYFHKKGPGFTIAASVADYGNKFDAYQVAATASYDYQQNRNFITGAALTHFFKKDSLPFYTSPLQNEAYAYVSIRKWWIRPSLSATYGWGSRTSYEERKEYIKKLRSKPVTSTTTVSTVESVADFALSASIKHDFYWLKTFFDNDFFRVTPLLSFTSGTQNYGFNQSTELYTSNKGKNKSITYNTENVSLTDNVKFAPISLTAFLKTEYSVGKFFIQPQFLVDYYFPASNKKISTAFAINTGLLL
ncbi:MAG TPA: hypothetical protein VM888_00875 [Chitinophagaceae bacterium]|nr:hypothetical protein [Chitinophagaceae bacterium]